MDNPVENYWKLRLDRISKALESNYFKVYRANTATDAAQVVMESIIPEISPNSVSWGGSQTFTVSGLYEILRNSKDIEVLDVFEKSLDPEIVLERRRQSLIVDLYITGTNAVTEAGQLVNLDMIGNRVGAITFGPKHVLILVGRNKIVSDVDDAMFRIKNYAAPTNSIRLNKKTPCVKTSFCEECKSPERICNTWTITEKSFPKYRTKIILINEDLGL